MSQKKPWLFALHALRLLCGRRVERMEELKENDKKDCEMWSPGPDITIAVLNSRSCRYLHGSWKPLASQQSSSWVFTTTSQSTVRLGERGGARGPTPHHWTLYCWEIQGEGSCCTHLRPADDSTRLQFQSRGLTSGHGWSEWVTQLKVCERPW